MDNTPAYPRRLFFSILVILPIAVYAIMVLFSPVVGWLNGWLGVGLPLVGSAMIFYWVVLDRRYVNEHGGASTGVQVLHIGLFLLALLWLGLAVGDGLALSS